MRNSKLAELWTRYNFQTIQPRAGPVKLARSPRTDPLGLEDEWWPYWWVGVEAHEAECPERPRELPKVEEDEEEGDQDDGEGD